MSDNEAKDQVNPIATSQIKYYSIFRIYISFLTHDVGESPQGFKDALRWKFVFFYNRTSNS